MTNGICPDIELTILNVIISFRISIHIPKHFSMTGEALVRRKWDYFVEHLLGAEPPKEYKFQ